MIESFWPKSGFDGTNTIMLDWWYKKIQALDSKVMFMALSKMADNERYAPTLATIKEYYSNVLQENLVDAEIGWGQVKKAVRQYGYMRADEAIKSLPLEVGKAVMAIGGWQTVCETPSEQETNMRAQFRQCLQAINKREGEERRTDNNIALMISNIREQNRPQIAEQIVAEEVHSKPIEHDARGFESVEDVLKKLGLRR